MSGLIMVIKSDVGHIIRLMNSLCYVNVSCQLIGKISTRVKDERGGVLTELKTCNDMLNSITIYEKEFGKLQSEIIDWIDKLEKEYRQNMISLEILDNKKWSLDVKDAKKLLDESHKWILTLQNYFDSSPLKTLHKDFATNFRTELYPKLEPDAQADFDDAIAALQSELPNPALAILFRVAERNIRQYYAQIMDEDPGTKAIGGMITPLRKSGKVEKHILGYLDYINKYRIDIAHPYKRFTQNESEEFLIQIKKLIEELSSILKK